ncbi:hypothetical protein HGA91_02675 [candidate division WWE3 bacterium]|nr:hypothetical protein [candidate division WWE3 bacterium]
MSISLFWEDRILVTRYLALVAYGSNVHLYVDNQETGFWTWCADIQLHVEYTHAELRVAYREELERFLTECQEIRLTMIDVLQVPLERTIEWTIVQMDNPVATAEASYYVGGRPGTILVSPNQVRRGLVDRVWTSICQVCVIHTFDIFTAQIVAGILGTANFYPLGALYAVNTTEVIPSTAIEALRKQLPSSTLISGVEHMCRLAAEING